MPNFQEAYLIIFTLFRSAVIRFECNFRDTMRTTCPAILEKCRSAEKQRDLMRNINLAFSGRELSLQNQLSFFSYNKCSTINNN